jgi:hypothetical protein
MSLILHHNDLDGHCSGAIVKLAHPEAELHSIDYGQPVPWDKIKKAKKVIMVDFCLQPFSDMVKLKTLTNLVWIDHHSEALKEADKVGFKAEGLRRNGDAGCELSWEYFFPKKEMPKPAYLLGRFDVWKHEGVKDCMEFKYGMEARDSAPTNSELWDVLLHPEYSRHDDLVKTIIEEGKVIKRYVEAKWEEQAQGGAFEVEFEGLKCIAMNSMGSGSLPFKSVWDKKKHDAMLGFGWADGAWSIGMYTDSKRDPRIAKVTTKNGADGTRVSFRFRSDIPPYKVRLKQDFVEFFISSKD